MSLGFTIATTKDFLSGGDLIFQIHGNSNIEHRKLDKISKTKKSETIIWFGNNSRMINLKWKDMVTLLTY